MITAVPNPVLATTAEEKERRHKLYARTEILANEIGFTLRNKRIAFFCLTGQLSRKDMTDHQLHTVIKAFEERLFLMGRR